MSESTPTPDQNQSSAPKKSNSTLWIVVLGIIIAGGIYWFVTTEADRDPTNDQESTAVTDAASQEPLDLAALPDVVARVDGTEITREEYVTAIAAAEQVVSQQGGDPSEPSLQVFMQQQALDQMINNAVLLQAAAEAGVTVTAEQIEAEYQLIAAQFPDADTFIAELELAGLTSEELRANIETGMTIDQFIEQSEAIRTLPAVTDAEAQAFHDDLVTQGTDGLPPLADIAEQIKAQIQSQNQQRAVSDLLQSLREAAEIELLLPETTENE